MRCILMRLCALCRCVSTSQLPAVLTGASSRSMAARLWQQRLTWPATWRRWPACSLHRSAKRSSVGSAGGTACYTLAANRPPASLAMRCAVPRNPPTHVHPPQCACTADGPVRQMQHLPHPTARRQPGKHQPGGPQARPPRLEGIEDHHGRRQQGARQQQPAHSIGKLAVRPAQQAQEVVHSQPAACSGNLQVEHETAIHTHCIWAGVMQLGRHAHKSVPPGEGAARAHMREKARSGKKCVGRYRSISRWVNRMCAQAACKELAACGVSSRCMAFDAPNPALSTHSRAARHKEGQHSVLSRHSQLQGKSLRGELTCILAAVGPLMA